MRKTVPFWVVIVVCAAALVASSLLLVDYVRPAPVFCAAEGGCGIVKRTVFAYPLGIPTPLIGIGGFLAIGLAQLLPGRRARIAQAMLAAFARHRRRWAARRAGDDEDGLPVLRRRRRLRARSCWDSRSRVR